MFTNYRTEPDRLEPLPTADNSSFDKGQDSLFDSLFRLASPWQAGRHPEMHRGPNIEHTMYYTKQHPFAKQQQPFNGMLERFFGNIDQTQGSDDMPSANIRANILETKEGFQLELLAPGYTKDELKLNVEKDILTLSAEHKQSELQEGQRFTRREFALRPFKRSFQLPELTDLDNITAEHVNGVLTVNIPKKVEVKAAVKEISIA